MTQRYWLSWNQPTEDHRPLTDPPHPQVLGWWCTGYNAEDNATLCALVEAENEAMAKVYVEISWPEAPHGGWRFCDSHDGKPLGDRFPMKPWMRERIGV